ncbi:MAG: HAMP domain-containing sensor histidine kinase [Actinomycetota bacterium]|nr:HAMP domain-containing sensor histidine kinase [Actinomycetota bacterium]
MTEPAVRTSRVKSIRSRVLSVLFLTGAIGIVGSFLIANSIERASENASLHDEVRAISRSVYQLAVNQQGPTVFDAISRSSPGFTITVYRDGSILYDNSATVKPESNIRDTRSGENISVTVVAPETSTTPLSAELTAVSAVVILGVLIGAVWVTRIISQLVGGSVERASQVAEKIEAGDLSARLEEALPPEFEQLASAFDNMANRLEESDLLQRRFLSDLAHEIATPINAVTGLAIAIADRTIDGEEEKREAAALIASETKRIYRLLEDLRELDRLELTNAVSVTAFDAGELCASAYARFAPEAKRKRIDLSYTAEPAELVQDRRLIETVIDNFLTNALRYVNTEDRVEIVGRKLDKTGYSISVRDTGIGIEERHLEKIFDRLYRATEARDRASGGTGLGLAIARKASLNVGGQIGVESTYGIGSTFTFTFPRILPDELGPVDEWHEGPPSQVMHG